MDIKFLANMEANSEKTDLTNKVPPITVRSKDIRLELINRRMVQQSSRGTELSSKVLTRRFYRKRRLDISRCLVISLNSTQERSVRIMKTKIYLHQRRRAACKTGKVDQIN